MLFHTAAIEAQLSLHDSLNTTDTNFTYLHAQVFSVSGDDADSNAETQDISSLLQSSKDVFTQFAGYQFGAALYRPRGYSVENQFVMINGISMSHPETNMATWSNWGGLNDVTRLTETRPGIVACRYGFTGSGGYTNMDSKASSFKKNIRFSYASSNRLYRHRSMFTYSTGVDRKGWAFSFSFSNRTGNEVYVPGTSFIANAFYASLDKKLNEKHLLSFITFVAPSEQGRTRASTLETYQLAGSDYYNSNWGYQNGEVRSAAVSRSNLPVAMFSHIYTPKKETRITTTIYQKFGQTSRTALNWYKAPIPQADYYKKLPSWFYLNGDTIGGNRLKEEWKDSYFRQIDWDAMISMNRVNLYSDPNTLGQKVNTTETRARYILERQVDKHNQTGFSSTYNHRYKNTFLSLGLNGFSYIGRKYKEVEDLLGASFWLDVDQFAEGLGVEEFIQQNDIDKPNRKVRTGEKFGYDYSLNLQKAELWGQAELNVGKLDTYFGLDLSSSLIWREGHMANGKFPHTSRGLSKKISFFNYGLKAGLTYKLNGRNYISMNGLYQTRVPEVATIFISPRVRQDIVDPITNEKIVSGDLSYIVKAPSLRCRVTFYHTRISDQLWLRTYWSDEFNSSVNLLMKDLDHQHQGIETGIEKIIFTSHSLQFALGYGHFVYANRPLLSAWQDNNSTSLYQERLVYLKNYKMGGTPQTVIGLGYRYSGRKNWFAGIAANYIAHRYIEPNPDRRTAESAGKYQEGEQSAAALVLSQEQLPAFSLLNANTGKSLRLKKKYFLNLNLSINNLLNRKHVLLSGSESMRWNPALPTLFANRYSYMTGITYMAIINLSF